MPYIFPLLNLTVTLFSSYYYQRKLRLGGVKSFPKVTQLGSGRERIQSQLGLVTKPVLLTTSPDAGHAEDFSASETAPEEAVQAPENRPLGKIAYLCAFCLSSVLETEGKPRSGHRSPASARRPDGKTCARGLF